SPPSGGEGSGEGVATLALDVPGRNGWTQLGHLLARLTVLGLPVRLAAWFEGRGLASESIAAFIARTRVEKTPKPSDWILLPNKATPQSAVRNPLSAKNGQRTEDSGLRTADSGLRTADCEQRIADSGQRIAETVAMTTPNGQVHVNRNDTLPAGSDLFAQFQATTRL